MANQVIMGVYRILNTVTEDFYIGSSNDVSARWMDHKRSLRRGDHHNFRLQADWDKYGVKSFVHTLLEEVESIDDLLDREQCYMDVFAPFYNVSKTATFRNDSSTHGDTIGYKRPHLYRVWQNMKTRCMNPNRATFKYYGGKGVTVCEEWISYEDFKDWSISNGYDPNLYLVRNDLNGHYSPSNCQWGDLYESMKSQKRAMRITAFGETKLLREWAKDARCVPALGTLHARIKTGWHPEDAILFSVDRARRYLQAGSDRERKNQK